MFSGLLIWRRSNISLTKNDVLANCIAVSVRGKNVERHSSQQAGKASRLGNLLEFFGSEFEDGGDREFWGFVVLCH